MSEVGSRTAGADEYSYADTYTKYGVTLVIIDACKLLSDDATKVVLDWAMWFVPSDVYETWLTADGKLALIAPGACPTDGQVISHVIPSHDLRLVKEWLEDGIRYRCQTASEKHAADAVLLLKIPRGFW